MNIAATIHHNFIDDAPVMRFKLRGTLVITDVTPFIGPVLMRVGRRGHAAAPF